jgi:hypothetical protein
MRLFKLLAIEKQHLSINSSIENEQESKARSRKVCDPLAYGVPATED